MVDLSPAEREKLWWSGIENMARIHRVDYQALGFDTLLDRPARGALGLDQQIAVLRGVFRLGAGGSQRPDRRADARVDPGQPAEAKPPSAWSGATRASAT